MFGIVSGAVAAMIFVSYLIKIGRFGGKKSKAKFSDRGGRNSPSVSSSKSTGIDESGCDEEKFV